MKTPSTLYLIDGSACMHRAYHAIRGLSTSQGRPTNAIFGYTRILLKLLKDHQPDYVAVVFDAKGPTFRHELYSAYKANRPPLPEDFRVQIPWIKDITAGFNLPVLEMTGYEADDLIGTLARQAQSQNFKVVIVTGDKDFMQLVNDDLVLWDPMKDITIDKAHVQRELGIDPEQVIDMMGLAGDSADNVPGVPGIGPKTAQKLIQSCGSLDALYADLSQVSAPKQRQKLLDYREQALLSRRLVTIDQQVPIVFDPEACRSRQFDAETLRTLFQTLEFRQLAADILTPEISETTDAPQTDRAYHTILSAAELEALLNRLQQAALLALDTETTSENPHAAELVGVSVTDTPFEAWYIPCGHEYLGAPEQLSCEQVLSCLRPLLENAALPKVGQNIKYDWIVLERHGVQLAGVVFDTMLASYLLNPSRRSHSLDQIAQEFLGEHTLSYQEVTAGNKAGGFRAVDLAEATRYAAEDADVTLRAQQVLAKKLAELEMLPLLETIEMPLVEVLKDMERRGIGVDGDHLKQLSRHFADQLADLEAEIHTAAGETFNINSPQQLGAILFDKLKLPVQKKTRKRTGYSTDVEVLETLSRHHELPALILRQRMLSKLKSTYTDALLELVQADGRLHTSFNQTITATGRLSSSAPNLQNIPIRTPEGRELRKAFIPRAGWQLVCADYSQIELRILAHVADDALLIEAFRNDEDIHSRTASEVFQVFPQMLTAELRRQAKVINFGIIYGMGAYSLSKELGITQKMAQTYIDSYFRRYQGVRRYTETVLEDARRALRVSTLMGRQRHLPDITADNRNLRQNAERIAINTPIQGSAADLIKLAMIQVHQKLREQHLEAAMLLSVHDEIVLEAPPSELARVQALVQNTMESVWELKVPLKVNLAVGPNWGEIES